MSCICIALFACLYVFDLFFACFDMRVASSLLCVCMLCIWYLVVSLFTSLFACFVLWGACLYLRCKCLHVLGIVLCLTNVGACLSMSFVGVVWLFGGIVVFL